MAHARMTISLMDSDLMEGMVRAILALHQGTEHTLCAECEQAMPCTTVRVIASFQDAAVARVSNPEPVAFGDFRLDPASEPVLKGPEFHAFKYPECPEFSGGICERHHGRPLHNPQLPSVA